MSSPPSGPNKVRQVEAIANGTVIDHIPAAVTLQVVNLLARPDDQVFIGVNLRSSRHERKGVVKIANRELEDREVSALSLIAPEASVCYIRNYDVAVKHQVPMPARFDAIAKCANPNCVTNHEKWPTRFDVTSRLPLCVRCIYCERSFPASELELL
jgi:aspartate carbamoyltransferase regulatory subunit